MLTFCMRVGFDEFVELRLIVRSRLGVDDTTNDDRAFASDHVDLFWGQVIQIRKVDLGDVLLNDINQRITRELFSTVLTSGPAWAISAVRVVSESRMSFHDAVRRSSVVEATISCFKPINREGLTYRSDTVSDRFLRRKNLLKLGMYR